MKKKFIQKIVAAYPGTVEKHGTLYKYIPVYNAIYKCKKDLSHITFFDRYGRMKTLWKIAEENVQV